ncbi:MAG TPA: head GIN domain-containing protein [Mucilaginibacter sp.]|nr:head GIN domain-containing protein [Mucilaginibacter sp.]
MNKKIQYALILLTLIISTGISSCRFNCVNGSGNQITQDRKIGSFNKIDVAESFKVVIREDNSNTISIKADDNLLKYIKTTVSDGTLHIYTKKNMCNSGEMIVKVPVQMLKSIKASDAAEVISEGKINAQDISIRLSDGSRISLELTASHVSMHGSDASVLNLSGQASTSEVQLSDGSSIHAKDFVSGTVSVRASDGSYAELNVLTTLNARGSDGSVIKYYGNPSVVNTDKSDGSSVEKAD